MVYVVLLANPSDLACNLLVRVIQNQELRNAIVVNQRHSSEWGLGLALDWVEAIVPASVSEYLHCFVSFQQLLGR
jgi:hypothetical protein